MKNKLLKKLNALLISISMIISMMGYGAVNNLTVYAAGISDAPQISDITVHNYITGINDNIKVENLAAGDMVKVYNAAAGGSLLGNATEQSGTAIVTNFTNGQLGTSSGTVYVTVTSTGMTESARTAVSYSAEPVPWEIYSHTGNWGEDIDKNGQPTSRTNRNTFTNLSNIVFGIPAVYPSGDDTSLANVQLNKHIIIKQNGQRVTFYGYGLPSYKDFIFLPTTDTTTRNVSFDFDLSKVSFHTMEGAGFLFNISKNSNGNLDGYALLIVGAVDNAFVEDTTKRNINIYRLTNVVPATLNQGNATTTYTNSSDSITDISGVSLIASSSSTNLKNSDNSKVFPVGRAPILQDVHYIKLEISQNEIIMENSSTGATGSYSTIMDYKDLTETGANGVGLIASHLQHGCSILSYLTFNNVVISDSTWPIIDLTAVSSTTEGKVDLSYTAPINAEVVVIEKSTDGVHFTSAATENPVLPTDSSATVTELTNGTAYTFRVLVGGGDNAGISNTATATPNGTHVNTAPVAVADSYSTAEDTTLTVAATGVLSNDSDTDGDGITAIKVTDPSNGTVTLNANGSFTYVPATNFNGTDSFTYKVNDGTVDGNTVTVTITVTPSNDAPAAVADSYSTAEDTTLTVAANGVLGNDSDTDGDAITAIKVTDPSNGTVTLSADGSFEYVPAANFNGSDSFTYKVNDGTVDGNTVTVTITVTPSNDAPAAVADSYSTAEDTTLTVAANGVLGNDSDTDGDAITAIKVTDPSNGTVTLSADGSFEYVPAANFNGSDSFTYKVNDGTVDGNTVTVTITVTPSNDAPAAVADSYSTAEDTTLTVAANGVLGNDSDTDGDAITAIKVTDPSNGTVTLSADGSFEYVPAANFNGSDSFTYKVNDGTVDGNTVTVTITVTPSNDAPAAVADSYSTAEDTTLTVAANGVLGNDSDTDGDAITAIKVTDPSNGTVTLSADGSFEYVPAANFNGSDSFTYKVNDGTVDGNTVTVTITVNAANDAPVAVADSYNTNEDATLTVDAATGVLNNDSDTDGDGITAIKVTDPGHGTVTLNADGSFEYVPAANFSGTDSFTYKVNDGTVDGNTVTVTITVNAENDVPVAVADSYSTAEDTTLTVAAPGVLSNDSDTDGDGITAIKVTDPSNGTVTLSADGSFEYVPAANFNGSDSFTYKVNDGTVDGNTVTVTITVNAANDAPVAVADSYNTNEDATLTVDAATGVLNNDSDTDGDGITAIKVTDPGHGTVTLNADGSFEYVPAANFSGTDSFTYKVNDGTVDGNTVTVTITVNAENDVPVAVADSYSTAEDTTLTVAAPGVLSNDSDTDGDGITAIKVTDPSNGTVTLSADGSFEYVPAANFNGSDSFTYKVNDGTVDGNTVTVTITVTPSNDAPAAVADSYSTAEDTTLTVAANGVLGNDSDTDGDAITAIKVTDPSNGTVTLSADGSFEYVPAANFNGSDSFTYKVNDGTVDGNTVTVTITVNPENDVPVAVADSYNTNEDTTLTVDAATGVLNNDSDTEGDAITAIKVTDPGHGTVTLNADGSFTYVPTANFSGTDSFTYKVNDGTVDGNTVTVTITVNAENDVPVAVADSYSTNEDTTLTVDAATGVLNNDSDTEGDTITAIKVTDPGHGTVTLNADGSFEYVPTANFSGADSFTYKVNDGTVDGNTVTVTITVNPENDVPVAVADSYSTNEDTTLTVDAATGVLNNDSDTEGDAITSIKVTDPGHGTVTLNADGSFTYVPTANFSGTDSFTYKVNDGTVDGNTVTVTITVNAENDVPVAVADSYSTNEDTTLTVDAATGVLNNDSDTEGDTITAIKVTDPGHGTVTLNADGSFEYVPTANFSGADSFTYKVNDGTVDGNTVTVTITVNPENDVPVAVADSYSTNEDTTLTVDAATGVLNNDSDTEGDAITSIKVTDPGHGTVTLNADGSFTYVPTANFSGTDSFTYKVNDGTVDGNTVTVTITVTPVNDAPTAVDDTVSVSENSGVTTVPVLDNDTDTDGGTLIVTALGTAGHGTASLTSGVVTYTSDTDYSGSDSFTYTISDGQGGTDTATVSVTVNHVNRVPSIPNYNISTERQTTVTGSVYATDADGDNLAYYIGSLPSHGSVTVSVYGAYSYTPVVDFIGSDMFAVTANDGNGGNATGIVNVTVMDWNHAPVIPNYNLSMERGATVTGSVYATDADGDSVAYYIGSLPSHGSVTLSVYGAYSYTPVIDFSGVDIFTVTASDGKGGNATSTVSINVLNHLPLLPDYSISTDRGTTVTGSVYATDADGDVLIYVKETSPLHGSVTVNSNGTYSYKPNSGFQGTDLFTVRVSDGHGGNATGTVNVTVNEGRYVLTGVVADKETNQPIAGATVILEDLAGNRLASYTTNSEGQYYFDNLLKNRYNVVIEKEQYSNSHKEVEVSKDKEVSGKVVENFELVKYQISLSASPATIIGNGRDETVLTANVLDKNGLAVEGIEVTFSAPHGSFYQGSSAVTDKNGNAVIPFRSESLVGQLTAVEFPVTATVADATRGLFAEDQIFITFAPGSIEGVVIDNVTGKPLAGAKVVVQKDFDGDGTIDFYTTVTTGSDGSYSIPVPRGATIYDVSVTKAVEIAGKTVNMTFTQKNDVQGEISGLGDTFESNRTVTGVILKQETEGQKAFLSSTETSKYKMEIEDDTGTVVNSNVAIDANTGIFTAENLSTGKTYELKLKYPISDTEFIVVGTASVTLNNNGEMNISEVLIDPYGTITDSVTGNPISGVYVVLHFNDGTQVNLPAVSGFPPADNANPQYSDSDGKYAFMVFPNRTYYITATKKGYYDFKSEDIPVGLEIVKYDFQMKKSPSGSGAGSVINPETPAEEDTERDSVIPDLAVMIQADSMKVQEGAAVDFTITYANKIDTPVGDVYVKVNVPDSMVFDSASGNGVFNGDYIKWPVGALDGKLIDKLSFKLKVKNIDKGEDFAKITAQVATESNTKLNNLEDDTSMIKIMLYSGRYEHMHKRYLMGYPDGNVDPDMSITRAEVAAIFARTLDLKEDVQNTKVFNDVEPDYWGAKYIEAVAKRGLFKGDEDSNFRPDDAITRAELVIATARYLEIAKEKKMDVILKLSQFTDTEGHWAEQSIEEIFRYKVVSGYVDNKFKPDQYITREEAVKMFNRMLYRGPLTGADPSYPDNKLTNWSFGDMEEATRTHYYKLNEDGTETMTQFVEEPLW